LAFPGIDLPQFLCRGRAAGAINVNNIMGVLGEMLAAFNILDFSPTSRRGMVLNPDAGKTRGT